MATVCVYMCTDVRTYSTVCICVLCAYMCVCVVCVCVVRGYLQAHNYAQVNVHYCSIDWLCVCGLKEF